MDVFIVQISSGSDKSENRGQAGLPIGVAVVSAKTSATASDPGSHRYSSAQVASN